VSALGGGAVAGRLLMGGVSDRIGRRPTIVIGMALQALAFLAFAKAHDVRGLALTAFGYGYAYGTTSTMFPAIVGDFFGRQHAGALVGLLFMLAGSMAALGPIFAGAVYDGTGGYGPAFYLAAAANVTGGALLTAARAPEKEL
jgi:OFA family oxalate/formate antiporter-like MFS transporter